MSGKQHKKKPLTAPLKPADAMQRQPAATAIPEWAIAVVLMFTALLYARVLQNGFVKMDDDTYLINNPLIRDLSLRGILNVFTTFHSYNYHPLTTLTNLVEFSLFGLNPVPYHVFNVVLHILNTWLVYKLINRLSGKQVVALAVAVLFSVNPMHVESVAWASERKDVLYTCFYLWSLLAYLQYLSSSFSVRYYFLVLLLFVLSLFSKSAAVTLPVLLLAADVYKGRRIDARMFAEKIPFFLLSFVFGMLAIKSQTSEMGGGTVNDLSQIYSYTDRFFLLTYSIAFYIVKLLFPTGLAAFHYFPAKGESGLPLLYYSSAVFLLATGIALYQVKPVKKVILFGVAFFFITISVMMVVPVGNSLVNERYTYVPSIGFFFLLAAIAVYYIKGSARNVALVLFAMYVLWLSYQTWNRIGIWKDSTTILTDVIEQNPEFYHAYWVRGNVELQADDKQRALEDFNKVLQYRPDFYAALLARGDLRLKLQDYNGCIKDLDQAIRIDAQNGAAYNTRGMAYDAIDSLQAALSDYNRAISFSPGLALAYNNRSVILAKTGNINGAISDINRAISLAPADVKMYVNRGNIRSVQNDYKGAIEDFTYAIRLKPDESMAYFNRAISRINLKDTSGACEDWKKAAQLGRTDAAQLARQLCHE